MASYEVLMEGKYRHGLNKMQNEIYFFFSIIYPLAVS